MRTDANGYTYLGDFSATPPWHSVSMSCDKCRVSWTGCWDNYQCPRCGDGELPAEAKPLSPESGREDNPDAEVSVSR